MSHDFLHAGRVLWEAGLLHFTSGNLSIRRGRALYVTRTGAPLGFLKRSDIVCVNTANALRDRGASSETPVHRAIYRALPRVRAVAHAHPVFATLMSLNATTIVPFDSDRLRIPRVPVLAGIRLGEGSVAVARKLPDLLRVSGVAMVRAHGAFAVGDTLERCVGLLTMMEAQCRLLWLRRLMKRGALGSYSS